VQQIATEKKVVYLGNGPSAAEQTGKFCSPYAFHFWGNTYSLSKGTPQTLTKSGGSSWFFITADYQFGYSLQAGAETFIKQAGGQILGSAKAPLGTTDFSAALVQAKASGAKVVAFANAGADLQNCIKQAAEFGIVKGGQSLATLLMFISDVIALGQDTCQGLVLTNSFYWNLTAKTRTWSDRFIARYGQPPNMVQAANYSGAMHWLKSAASAKSLDGTDIAKTMHQTPVNDFYHDNTPVMANGQLQETMHIWRVKPSAQAKSQYDVYDPVGTIPGKDAFIPAAESGCNLA
jgi:branched-chain amino acid transport system substrate-binding protein